MSSQQESGDGLCASCTKRLLQNETMAMLLTVGLKFTIALDKMNDNVVSRCGCCWLMRDTLLNGEFTGKRGDEAFRFSTAVWGRSSLDFMLKAKIEGDDADGDLVFEVYVEEVGPIQYFAASSEGDNASLYCRMRLKPLMEQIKSWISECVEIHNSCPGSTDVLLPSRLLDVCPEDRDVSLKLVHTRGIEGRYIALSYCWGGDQPAKLTTKLARTYAKSIDESRLPQTVQDAITMTRNLGFRFLWIDAYCILQDSASDKAKEIAMMDQVYSSSFTTLVASGSERSIDGFPIPQQEPRPLRLIMRFPNRQKGTLHLSKTPDLRLTEPIDMRAWTLQERVLSRRIVSFRANGPALEWQCDTAHESNVGPCRYPFADKNWLFSDMIRRLEPVQMGQSARLRKKWSDIISKLTARQMSDQSDRLPAVAGIAKRFNPTIGGNYAAGLWEVFLPTNLLWVSPNGSVQVPEYRGPSWSWASVTGEVSLPHGLVPPSRICAKVLEMSVNLASEMSQYGEVTGGYLKIEAPAHDCVVQGERLLDTASGSQIGTASIDIRSHEDQLRLFCFAIHLRDELEDHAHTPTSETSEFLHTGTEGLLLEFVGDEHPIGVPVFKRVGIFSLLGSCSPPINIIGWERTIVTVI